MLVAEHELERKDARCKVKFPAESQLDVFKDGEVLIVQLTVCCSRSQRTFGRLPLLSVGASTGRQCWHLVGTSNSGGLSLVSNDSGTIVDIVRVPA